MLSVSQFARKCGLGRTTVLYYEACGLLKPALRSAANYRYYGENEVRLLEQVRLYRSIGLSVRDIGRMLGGSKTETVALLQRRLQELDAEIQERRSHQQLIVRLLRNKRMLRTTKNMTKEQWTAIMRSAGFTDDDMHRWHHEFERSAPEEHQAFLQYLHIPEDEVRLVREWSRKAEDRPRVR